jgi:hypothetical protein
MTALLADVTLDLFPGLRRRGPRRMPARLREHLAHFGGTATAQPIGRNLGEYEADLDLNVGERIVADLVAACQTVAAKVDALTALPK